MLREIKQELLNDVDSIVELLDFFDFAHIRPSAKEIRFARNEEGGQNIRIRLENNDYLIVNDYVTSDRLDIFSYIIKEKNTTFYEVLHKTKEILGLDYDWKPKRTRELFGGFYNHLSKSSDKIVLKIYDESILDQYKLCANVLFLRDGISVKSQKFFGLRYSVTDDRIIIPIRNEWGELVGAKGRYNGTPEGDNPKYIYPIPVMASQVLFGYSQNYEFLYNADVIYVGESEKFVMQCHSMGIRTCVALGSHTLSEKQAKLLIQLQPKKIVFMLDEGLDLIETINDSKTIEDNLGMWTVDIGYFDYRLCDQIKHKQSPSDGGYSLWSYIVDNCIKDIEYLKEEYLINEELEVI